jgi:hypothetical protein
VDSAPITPGMADSGSPATTTEVRRLRKECATLRESLAQCQSQGDRQAQFWKQRATAAEQRLEFIRLRIEACLPTEAWVAEAASLT